MTEQIRDDTPTRLRGARTPPHSIEAERSVLGGLMLNNEAFDRIADLIVPDDFYRPEHRMIYAAMVVLASDQQPLDVVTISQTLEGRGELRDIGGVPYLARLLESPPAISNLPAYARIVREQSTLRQLIGAANRIAESAFEPQGREPAELIDSAESAVFEIAEGRQRGEGPVGARVLLSRAVDRIDQLYSSAGGLTGLASGFDDLDQMTSGLQRSDLVIVAARPSMGKTSFSMNLVEHALMQEDMGPVLVFSLEMPADGLILRMLSSLGQIDFSHIRSGQLKEEDWPRLTSTINLLKDKPLFIDDSAGLTPTELRARARRIARDHGRERRKRLEAEGRHEEAAKASEHHMGMVVVDYLQLMRAPGAGDNRAQEISEISRSLKALAKELSCPVVALAQLNRALEQRPNKRPVMSDLRESGAIEQDADVILFIYRDEVYNPESADKGVAEIIIGKQRNGPIGSVRLQFTGRYVQFRNLASSRYDEYSE